ncbi:MAG: hypothetical protein ACRDV9_15500, partial [Acidimicrobiia bacterium]
SRPVTRAETRAAGSDCARDMIGPQWSRPVTRAETPAARRRGRGGYAGRNGAARHQGGDAPSSPAPPQMLALPQWSRPVTRAETARLIHSR